MMLFGVEGMHILDVSRDPDVGGGQGLVGRQQSTGALCP